jgi:hypothetical protein
MKRTILAILALLWALPVLGGPAEDEVATAAKTWLAVVDARNYSESWKDAADLFQQGVSQDKWDGMVRAIRDKVGPVKTRQFQTAQFTKTLPGVPDGDYAIVTFGTDFESRVDSIEVITLIHEDGGWKVGGYFIH